MIDKKELKMINVTVINTVMFEGKEKKPGSILTVSEAEAENLRRIKVIAETTKTEDVLVDNHNNDSENSSVDGTQIEDKPLDIYTLTKKQLKAEIVSRKIETTGRENKATLIHMIRNHENENKVE